MFAGSNIKVNTASYSKSPLLVTTTVRGLPLIVPTMASFVREILSATGHLGEKEDFCAKATRLKGRVDELKVTF